MTRLLSPKTSETGNCFGYEYSRFGYLIHGSFHPVSWQFYVFSKSVRGRGLELPKRGVVLGKKVVHLYRSTRHFFFLNPKSSEAEHYFFS